jgi:hypothetical protein
MKLYRIEHKATTDGMWTVKFDGELVLEKLTDRRLAEMPMPHDDIHRTDGKIWKTAVGSMADMSYWFSKRDVQEMVDNGFIMIEFDCEETIEMEHQIIFNDALRENVVDVTAKFLESV